MAVNSVPRTVTEPAGVVDAELTAAVGDLELATASGEVEHLPGAVHAATERELGGRIKRRVGPVG